MANTAVNVTLAGDSSGLQQAFQRVEGEAQQLARKFEDVEEPAGRLTGALEGAETAGDRTERGFRGLSDVMGVTAQAFGLPLGPLGTMLPMITQLGGGIADLAPTLAQLPGLQNAAAAASRVQATAQAALNAVMDANPIFLVVTAIALLVGAFITAYTTSATFRDIVNGVFTTVLGVAQTVFGAIQTAIMGPYNWAVNNWPLILAILTGPIGLAVLAIVDNWNSLVTFMTGLPGRISSAVAGMFDEAKNLATDAYSWVTGEFNDLVTDVGTAIGKVPGLISGIVGDVKDAALSIGTAIKDGIVGGIQGTIGVIGNLGDALLSALKSLINTAIDAINNAIPNDIGFSVLGHFIGVDLPDNPIPHLAAGGIVTGPTLAVIGERGPEAVVPLSRGAGIAPPVTYHIEQYFSGPTTSKELADAMDAWLERQLGYRAVQHGIA